MDDPLIPAPPLPSPPSSPQEPSLLPQAPHHGFFLYREVANAVIAFLGFIFSLLVICRIKGWMCMKKRQHVPREGMCERVCVCVGACVCVSECPCADIQQHFSCRPPAIIYVLVQSHTHIQVQMHTVSHIYLIFYLHSHTQNTYTHEHTQ